MTRSNDNTAQGWLLELPAQLRTLVEAATVRLQECQKLADGEPSSVGFPLPSPTPPQPMPPAHPLIEALMTEASEAQVRWDVTLKDLAAGRGILAAERGQQIDLVIDSVVQGIPAAQRFDKAPTMTRKYTAEQYALWAVSETVLKRKLLPSPQQLARLASALLHLGSSPPSGRKGMLKLLETFVASRRKESVEIDEDTFRAIATIGECIAYWFEHGEERKVRKRLAALAKEQEPPADEPRLTAGERWADVLLSELEKHRPAWQPLLVHCQKARSARPSKTWRRQMQALLAQAGEQRYAEVAAEALRQVGRAGSREIFSQALEGTDRTLVDEEHADLLRGLVWGVAQVDAPLLTAALGDAAVACFEKMARHGARCSKVGNACLLVLAEAPSAHSAAQLVRLRHRVKDPKAQPRLEQALMTVAKALGVSVDELEETSVQSYGLSKDGTREEAVGNNTAVLRVDGTQAHLEWINASGRKLRGVPATVRRDNAETLLQLRATARGLGAQLLTQRDRLERIYREPRHWPLATWRERYLDHPLLGSLARRLIWQLDGPSDNEHVLVLFSDGQLTDQDGHAVELGADRRVALWHPLDTPAEQIGIWRRRLEDRGFAQPFKQAHRETYRLSQAESGTATYSNRFAAHIIRQLPFASLCRERGWRYTPHAIWGDGTGRVPTLTLEGLDLQVQFWVEPVGVESERGTYDYLSTDQVRFCDLSGEPRRLDTLPPLLFSELMRDVDLFVSVCSIGNDPDWADRGAFPAAVEYWSSVSFGELGASAQIRRELMGRLLPKLKIGPRCSLEERFVVVRGRRRTYRIHLGTGNVLIEPGSSHLCIMADFARRSTTERPLLPFSGDGQLTLILSKMMMLVHDDEITDPLISSQIDRGI